MGLRTSGRAESRLRAGLKKPAPANVAAVVIFLVMALRLGFVVGMQPIIGYANNLDFFRQSACVGVWQPYPGQERVSAHVDAPSNDLVRDGVRISTLCMASSDNLFVWLASRFHRPNAHFQLREVGASKALLTIVLVGLMLLQPIGASARLASAFTALLVFGDIAVACYFNTLYVDASAIIAATLAVLGTVLLCARAKPMDWASAALIAGPLLWLGMIKPQYEVLACLQGFIDGIILLGLWRDLPKACVIVAVGVAGPLVFNTLNNDPDNIMRFAAKVNQADVILQAVLPTAPNKARALEILGLPESCTSAIGRNGYDDDVRAGRLCPDVSQVSRLRLLPLFIRQPLTFFLPFSHGIDFSRPALLEHFHPFAQIAPSSVALLKATSLSALLMRFSKMAYKACMVFVQVCGCVVLVWQAREACSFLKKRTKILLCPAPAPASAVDDSIAVQAWRQKPFGSFLRKRTRFALALIAMGSLDCLYAIASAVFGDGYIEASRHEVLVLVGASAFLSGFIWCVFDRVAGLLVQAAHTSAPGS